MRALALGWTGANCVKWLHKITVLDQPHEGFFMDRVYRVFQKGEDPKTGEVVKAINIKSIIVEPANAEALPTGIVPIRGAAYAGEAGIQAVDVSLDDGRTWQPTKLIGPDETYVGGSSDRRIYDYGPGNGYHGAPAAGDGQLECPGLRE
jgi:DMSO/TMAO reductase YedYZ molybdopterin-dependent catalytic subunit